MAKVSHTIRFDPETYNELKRISEQGEFNNIVNEACKFYLRNRAIQDVEKLYTPVFEEWLEKRLKRFEDRIASSVFKTAHDAAQILFLLLPLLSEHYEREQQELYYETRGIAAKHVKNKGLFRDSTKDETE